MSLTNGDVCRVAVEDCRDFLRTGRCKYGASCKYNHPPNVQTGGGIKQIDPSEPMFPLRPNEPVCQYYMKHGTCKFGQACKFHHPPQNTLFGGMPNGSGPSNSGSRRPEPATQLLLNPVGPDPNGQGMMLQFLPQRPEEADCIYFLKNGRCKYGATCRYHHPIQQRSRSQIDSHTPRVRQDSFGRTNNSGSHNKVQYIAQVIQKYPNGLASEGGIVTLDSNSSKSLQQQSYVVANGDGFHSYGFSQPQGSSVVMTEQSSSTSSVASSFDLNQDMLGVVEPSRPRRNMSVGSFSNGDTRMQQPLTYMSHSVSETNVSHRRGRAASYGSIQDSRYPDPHSSNITPWNQAARVQESTPSPRSNPTPRRSQKMGRRGVPPDEGFTRMTSALLNMLDTTEEHAGENYSDEELPQHQEIGGDTLMHLNQLSLHETNGPHQNRVIPSMSTASQFQPLPQAVEQPSYPSFLAATKSHHRPHQQQQDSGDWKPGWQKNSRNPGTVPMLAPNSAPSDGDIGLYLP